MIDWFILVVVLGLGTCFALDGNYTQGWIITLVVAVFTQLIVNQIRKYLIKSSYTTPSEPQKDTRNNKISPERQEAANNYNYKEKGQIPVRVNDLGSYYIDAFELSDTLTYLDKKLTEEAAKKFLDSLGGRDRDDRK